MSGAYLVTQLAEEFEPVVEAFKAFLVELRCANCNAGLRVTPKRGPLELLGCDCGERNLALKEKEK
jgi:hypothetical protein